MGVYENRGTFVIRGPNYLGGFIFRGPLLS